MIPTLLIVGAIACSWIAYREGYERGREYELNKAAERVERMSRFYETHGGMKDK